MSLTLRPPGSVNTTRRPRGVLTDGERGEIPSASRAATAVSNDGRAKPSIVVSAAPFEAGGDG